MKLLFFFFLLTSLSFLAPASARIIQRKRPLPTSTKGTAAFSSEAAAKQREEDDERLLPESIPKPTPRAVDDPAIVASTNVRVENFLLYTG